MIWRSVSKMTLFIFFSVVDLRIEVRAREIIRLPLAQQVVQQPKNCILQSSECTVMTLPHTKFELSFGSSRAIMDEDTVVIRLSAQKIILVKGRVWIHATSPVVVTSEFGEAQIPMGEFWAEKLKNKIVFTGISGDLQMTPKGTHESIGILPLHQNWLGPVGPHGIATSGIPNLLFIEDHVHRWGKLYPKGKREFKKEVHELFKTWYELVEVVSDKHRSLALRSIADQEEKRRQQAFKRSLLQREFDWVKEMMRRRLIPPTL